MKQLNLVVLTGAGISAESGLKTFRDDDGLWEGYDLNEVATATAWRRNPARVLEFYNQRRLGVLAAMPNGAHYALAKLQQDFNVTIITQNIDDLHERAGSAKVLHLHGEIVKMRSEKDDATLFPYEKDLQLGDLATDGGQLRPHVVWFEEPVPMMEEAMVQVQIADVFLVVGTSLAVYPAAGLLDYAPRHIPKIIVDKKIPPTAMLPGLVAIEQSAVAGLKLVATLLANHKEDNFKRWPR